MRFQIASTQILIYLWRTNEDKKPSMGAGHVSFEGELWMCGSYGLSWHSVCILMKGVLSSIDIRLLNACYASLLPALLFRPSVRPSHFTFFVFCGLWPLGSCPNDQPLPTCTRLYPFILTPSKLFFSLFRLLSLTKQSYFKNSVQLKMREQVYHI